MGECLRCGRCCRAVALPYTKAQIRSRVAAGELDGSSLRSARFVLRYWRRIGRSSAARVPGLRVEPGYRYYRCTKLVGDECSDHARRPDICRGFPYYGDSETTNVDDRLVSAECGYHTHR